MSAAQRESWRRFGVAAALCAAALGVLIAAWPVAAAAAYRNVAAVRLSRELQERQIEPRDPLAARNAVSDASLERILDATARARAWRGKQAGVRHLEAGAYLGAGRPLEALDALGRTGASRPADPLIDPLEAAALYRVGRVDEAISLWRRVGAGSLIAAYAERQSAEQRAEGFGLALRIDPDNTAARLGLARWHEETGAWEMALAEYRAAFDSGPPTAAIADRIAAMLSNLGKHGEALPWHALALEWHPRYPPYLIGLGEAYQALGRRGEAEAAFREAVAVWPWHWWPRTKLGLALAEKGAVAEGLRELRQATAIGRESREAWLGLGTALLEYAGEAAPAAAAFEETVRIDPASVAGHLGLARAYERVAPQRAAAEYCTVLRLDPRRQDVRTALERLGATRQCG